MGKAVLAGIFILAASTALAQTDSASDQAAAGGPANLCQELLAFITKPPSKDAAATAAPAKAPAAPAASDQARSNQGAGAPATQAGEPPRAAAQPAEKGAAPASETAAAGKDAPPASGQAVPPQPVEQTQSAQQASGQSGPAHGAPEQNTQPTREGQTQNAELKSGLSAPVPTDATSTPQDAVLNVAEAEKLAAANDIAACQTAAKKLRLAGVAMPPPLLALTALDLQYQQAAEPRSQAPEAEDAAAPKKSD
jgi:hypothetical protein